MSRSRKKTLAFKDPANRTMKPIAARRHRRVVNQAVRTGQAQFLEEIPLPEEVVNPYTVCDFVFLCGEKGRCDDCWIPEEERYKCRMK